MSAAEWFEVSLIAGANSLTGFAILFSMISGYMVVAYAAGQSLTIFQVSLANTVYVVGCLFMVFSNYSHVRDAIVARQQAVSMVAEISPGVGFMPATWAGISGAVYCSFVIGSLVFMWQIRHPKSG